MSKWRNSKQISGGSARLQRSSEMQAPKSKKSGLLSSKRGRTLKNSDHIPPGNRDVEPHPSTGHSVNENFARSAQEV